MAYIQAGCGGLRINSDEFAVDAVTKELLIKDLGIIEDKLSEDLQTKINSGGSSYTLPTASTTVLGGVKVGTNLSIDGSGILSASGGTETTITMGALINNATAKAIPVDADMLPLMDSASSNIVKKLSWANIKSTLKTYLDTLYVKKMYSDEYEGKKGVWFGDSIVADAQGTGHAYPVTVGEYLKLQTSFNLGMSGRPIANGTVNGNGTVTTVTTFLSLSQYDSTFIAGGTNDFKLNVPLGTLGVIGDTTFDDTTFYGAYRKMLEFILTTKPSMKVLCMTPLQRDNAGYDVNFTNSVGCKLIDYVNAIITVCNMYSIPVCDLYRESGVTKLTLATYTSDGLHLNTTGYYRVSKLIAQRAQDF